MVATVASDSAGMAAGNWMHTRHGRALRGKYEMRAHTNRVDERMALTLGLVGICSTWNGQAVALKPSRSREGFGWGWCCHPLLAQGPNQRQPHPGRPFEGEGENRLFGALEGGSECRSVQEPFSFPHVQSGVGHEYTIACASVCDATFRSDS
jgi:hypothetical protein